MITKETLDQLSKEIDKHFENVKPGELMAWLMEHRAKQFLGVHTLDMAENTRVVELLAGFATEELTKAKQEWNLQQISDFGQIQTCLEQLEECKNK